MTGARANRATARASLAGIVWVNEEDVDPTFQGFILDEGLELRKGPGVLDQALFTLDFDPLSNMRQVFQDNRISRFERVNDLAADDVVTIFHPITLSARQPVEHLASGRCAFALERGTQLGIFTSDVHSLFAIELEARAGRSQIYDTQVYAHSLTLAPCGIGSGSRLAKNNVDVELAFTDVERSRRGLLSCQERTLIVTNRQLDLVTALYSAETDLKALIPQLLEPEEVFIQIEKSGLESLGSMSSSFGSIDRSDDAGKAAHNIVRGKIVTFLQGIVEPAVQGVWVGNLMLQSHYQSIVAGLRVQLQRLLQRLSIFWRDLELTLDRLYKFHAGKLYHTKGGDSRGRFLTRAVSPRPKFYG